MKLEIVNGKKVTFEKKYKYISKDFPASPYVVAKINGKEVLRGFTKSKLLEVFKRRINKKRGK